MLWREFKKYKNQQWTDRLFHPNRLHIIFFVALIFNLQWSNKTGYRCLMIKRFSTELICFARTAQILFCSIIALVLLRMTRFKVSFGDTIGEVSGDNWVSTGFEWPLVDKACIEMIQNWVKMMIFIGDVYSSFVLDSKYANVLYKIEPTSARELAIRMWERQKESNHWRWWFPLAHHGQLILS